MFCPIRDVSALPKDVFYLFSDKKTSSSELFSVLFRKNDFIAEIFYRDGGQPYGITKEGEEFPLSATNHKNFSLVCAKERGFLGADLQTAVDWSDPEKQKIAFTEKEITSCNGDPARFDFLWTAKECLLKSVGIGLGKGYNYVEISTDFADNCHFFFKNGEEKLFLRPALFRLPFPKGCCLIFAADCATIKK